MSLAIDCVTVCVDYSEYLALTVKNKAAFDRWMIVTVERDQDTVDLCKQEGLEYCFSERLYEEGSFCKGKAINDAILKMDPQNWMCVVDADTYLFAQTLMGLINDITINIDCIYGLHGRVLLKDGHELQKVLSSNKISQDEIKDTGLLAGFFQMWHSSMRQFYPEQSTHAGLDDILMRDSYEFDKRIFLPAYCIHIGELWVNHKGVPRNTSP